MAEASWDCIVVGAGPGGLTAALYLARYRRRVLVVHDGKARALRIPLTHNVPGFPEGVCGTDLIEHMTEHATRYGAEMAEGHVARIVRGEPMESIKAPTRVSQGKPPCGRCYIYLEHQTYKFRMLSPLALPLTIAIGFFGYPIYDMAFKIFDKGAQSVWNMFSFKPPVPDAIATSKENIDAVTSAVSAAQVSSFAQAIFGVMLGFILLIYISKGIEWAIFKAKL